MPKQFLVLVILAACLAIGHSAPTTYDTMGSAEAEGNQIYFNENERSLADFLGGLIGKIVDKIIDG